MSEKIYCKNPDIVFRKISDELILVPIRQNVGDLESIYTLNETGGRIWELIDGKRNTQQIRDLVASEFEVEPKDAEKDVEEFLRNLAAVSAIQEV